ncbi:ComF family protein [Alcanivorax sp. JB21]|nr:ComF family protein [Alcanivorax limicola]
MSISKVYEWTIFNLLQPPCPLCRLPAEIPSGLCAGCLADITPMAIWQPGARPGGYGACRCGLPLAAGAGRDGGAAGDLPPLCGRCLRHPPAFDRVVAPLAYQFPLDLLLLGYKRQRRLVLERPLLHLWHTQLALIADGRLAVPRPEALVPVPLHWRRLWWRGFNPAARLADTAATRLAIPVLPALIRPTATPSQQGLDASARRRNLRNALIVDRPVDGLHLALVDDVVTTGSTAQTAALALLRAGAARVDVWALARTLPGPSDT